MSFENVVTAIGWEGAVNGILASKKSKSLDAQDYKCGLSAQNLAPLTRDPAEQVCEDGARGLITGDPWNVNQQQECICLVVNIHLFFQIPIHGLYHATSTFIDFILFSYSTYLLSTYPVSDTLLNTEDMKTTKTVPAAERL